jgi:glutamine amidotransferase
MCRHLAYLGPPVPLATLVFDVPHALVEQAASPKLQVSTPTNPDGWGVAWYGPGDDPPRQYRTAVPIWDDVTFVPEHATVTAGAFVAAVRAASPGSRIDADNNAPFVAGQWTFSLNGFVAGFRDGAGDKLRARLSPARASRLQGDTDTEVLLALVLDLIDRGYAPDAAVAEAATTAHTMAGGRLNLLLSDGEGVVATTLGNSLFVRSHAQVTVIASEPLDDRAGWVPVPNSSVVSATAGRHDIRPLAAS